MTSKAARFITQLMAEIAQRDARIAELEAERARWEHLAQKAWDKSDVEFAADIATAIDAVGEKAQRPASQKGLAAQVLKAQDAIKQWPPELRAGVRIPDPKEWLASGQPSDGVVVGALVSALEGIVHDERVPNEVSQDYAALLIDARRLNPCRAQAVTCVACEGHPMRVNNPCAVCGGAQDVPDGYVLVPLTREAIHLAFEHKLRAVNQPHYGERRGDWRTLNREELADVVLELLAAPSAQQKESGDE